MYDISQPVWILKTAKEKQVQRLVSMSVDLARQVGLMLDDISGKVISQYIPRFPSFSWNCKYQD
jgi:hypothetical protein